MAEDRRPNGAAPIIERARLLGCEEEVRAWMEQ